MSRALRLTTVLFFTVLTLSMLAPVTIFASNHIDSTQPSGNTGSTQPPGNTGTTEPPANDGQTSGVTTETGSIKLENPLSGIGSIEGLAKTLLNVFIVLAAPIVVFFIIFAGFKYVTAQGDPTKLEEAKRALVYAIIGGVIIVGATAIFEIVVNTINAFKS